jgi:hypothetical protein
MVFLSLSVTLTIPILCLSNLSPIQNGEFTVGLTQRGFCTWKLTPRKKFLVKKIYNWKLLTKRSQGRPKYRWEDNTKQDICQMRTKNWIACVQDRGKCKEVFEKAKTFN